MGPKHCSSCGRIMGEGARFCQICGHDRMPEAPQGAVRKDAGLSGTGGVLLILSSAVSFIGIPFLLDATSGSDSHSLLSRSHDFMLGLCVVIALCGVVTLIGGVLSLNKSSYNTAVAGGLLSVFGMGMVLGLAGLICVVTSKADFGSYQTPSGGWPPQAGPAGRGTDGSLDARFGARRQ